MNKSTGLFVFLQIRLITNKFMIASIRRMEFTTLNNGIKMLIEGFGVCKLQWFSICKIITWNEYTRIININEAGLSEKESPFL